MKKISEYIISHDRTEFLMVKSMAEAGLGVWQLVIVVSGQCWCCALTDTEGSTISRRGLPSNVVGFDETVYF